MRQFKGQALDQVAKALGLTGAGSIQTQFEDGSVVQNLDVGPFIRRGRTLAHTEGIYTGVLSNVHTNAETLQTTITLSLNQPVAAIAPFPTPIPSQFDLWLIAAAIERISGTGTLTASLRVQYPAAAQAFGIDDSGVAVVDTSNFNFGYWDSIVDQTVEVALQNGETPTAKIGLRMLPGTGLRFSSTSSATSSYNCHILIGLFPIGMGQDIIT